MDYQAAALYSVAGLKTLLAQGEGPSEEPLRRRSQSAELANYIAAREAEVNLKDLIKCF